MLSSRFCASLIFPSLINCFSIKFFTVYFVFYLIESGVLFLFCSTFSFLSITIQRMLFIASLSTLCWAEISKILSNLMKYLINLYKFVGNRTIGNSFLRIAEWLLFSRYRVAVFVAKFLFSGL